MGSARPVLPIARASAHARSDPGGYSRRACGEIRLHQKAQPRRIEAYRSETAHRALGREMRRLSSCTSLRQPFDLRDSIPRKIPTEQRTLRRQRRLRKAPLAATAAPPSPDAHPPLRQCDYRSGSVQPKPGAIQHTSGAVRTRAGKVKAHLWVHAPRAMGHDSGALGKCASSRGA